MSRLPRFPSPAPTPFRFVPGLEPLGDRIVPSLLTTRASADVDPAPVPSDALNPAVSGDGRFVAFVTASRIDASGAGDSNGGPDVYLKDRLTGTVTLVSQPTGTQGGATGANSNTRPSVSDDGRYVAYEKTEVTAVLIPRVPPRYFYNYRTYVLLRDTWTNTTTAVAEGDRPHLSGDGRYLTFTSAAVSPGPNDANGILPDIFLYDRVAGTNTVVSTDANGVQGNLGYTFDSAVSRGGRFVAVVSTSATLVPGDTNSRTDVFLKDTATGAITRVSVATDGTEGDGESGQVRVSVSDDGRFVVFQSDADNLVPGDTNHATDVFIRDVVLGSTARLSADAGGIEGNAGSYNPAISGDGRFVVFESQANNLVPGDATGSGDVFVVDRVTGTIRRVSVSTAGAEGNAPSVNAAVSRDGRFVAFQSSASNLAQGDGNGVADVFVRQLPRPAGFAAAAATGSSRVQVFDAGGRATASFDAYPGFPGGVAAALGDLTGDGLADAVTGPGAGGGPNVRVFDGATGGLAGSFLAYDAGFAGGVNVSVGDVDGDGYADIACGPGAGGGPNVRVFSGKDHKLLASFFAYDETFAGGVRVAVGDVNGDGFADIICAPGIGGGSNVRVFDGRTGSLARSFFALPEPFTGGVFVSAGDVDNDGSVDIVCGPGAGGPNVRAFGGTTSALLASVYAFDAALTGGVRVGGADVNQDGYEDYVVGTGPGTGGLLRVISGKDAATQLLPPFAPFGGFSGGVNVG